MKTEDSISQNWDDLVFENRNRSYGAFALRKAYTRNVSEGMLLSLLFVGLVFITPQIVAYIFGTPIIPRKIIDPPILVLQQVPGIIPTERKKTATLPVEKAKPNVVPVVSSSPVNDDILATNKTNASAGKPDGMDGGAPAEDNSGAAIAAPAVVLPPPTVDHAEIMPAFPGGVEAMMKFIQKKMKYPHYEMVNGIEGLVYIQFVVNFEGRVVDVKVVRGFSPNCDREASRVIAMLPDWKPGRQNKMPVSVRMIVPIKFKLSN